MFIVGNFLFAAARILDTALSLYMWVIIIRAVLSWVNPNPYNPIVAFLYRVTEPVLSAVRRKLPQSVWGTGIDFSPLVVIFGILFLRKFLVRSLIDLARNL